MTRWVLVLVLSNSMAAVADAPVHVEARRPEGDGYFEFRVTTHCRSAPSILAELVWSWNDAGVEAKLVHRRLVVSESARERLVWSLLRPPAVAARESLIRFKRTVEDGAEVITFQSDEGATPPGERVGLRVRVKGSWRFTHDGQGGSMIEHRITSDPGGGLPAWLVKGAQEDMAVALVTETVQRAEAR